MLSLVHREFARARLGNWEQLEGTVGESIEANVEYYRWMQVAGSQRFLFSDNNDFSFAMNLCAEQPSLCEKDRQHMEIWAGGNKFDNVPAA